MKSILLELNWQIRAGQGMSVLVGRRNSGGEIFDADKVGCVVMLRHWRPDDRFQPIGMKAPVKLQDLFTNQKIPREHRRALVVGQTRNGEIFWVEGLRLAEKFKLERGTSLQLRWRWQRRVKLPSPAI